MKAKDALEALKAELARMREEEISMKSLLRAAESALEDMKRVLSEFKAMEKLTNDMLDVFFIELAGGDNIQDLDDETMKGLIEEAMRNFTDVLNDAQSHGSRPADGGNCGGHDGSTGDDRSKEAGGTGGGNKGGNSSGHPE
ncbi:glycine-rich RNA-binding protein 8-like [Durio zibethinus]|uniref:Glycine-rich RNA-binding protein 8-like n=1 Tax=Durio zibethinus TaxID=66656 RepID=A0A6P5WS76_DURZI|nr:glycine-rich RNA-binding protein 8-like [Durio zibethinus]